MKMPTLVTLRAPSPCKSSFHAHALLPLSYRLLWFLPIYNHCDFYVLVNSINKMLRSILNENVSKPRHREEIVLAKRGRPNS
jgi:hypothetical protein